MTSELVRGGDGRGTIARRFARFGWFVRFALALASASTATSADRVREETETASESTIKAAFIYNFVKFIEWPGEAAINRVPSIVLGVLGDDVLAADLESVVAGRTVAGRPLEVRRFSAVDKVRPCHILFVAASKAALISDVLDRLAGAPVLTVGDVPGFARAGGIVNFYDQDRRIRFEVNREAAELAGLNLSSRLLGLARIVKGSAKRP